MHELLVAVGTAVHLGDSTELGVGAQDQVDAGGSPLLLASLAVGTLEELGVWASWLPDGAHVKEVDEEVVCQVTNAIGEDTVGRSIVVGAQDTETTDQGGQLDSGEVQEVSSVDEVLLSGHERSGLAVVAESIVVGLEMRVGLNISLLLSSIVAAWSEGDGDTSSLLDGGGTSQDDQIGERDLLAAASLGVEVALDALQSGEDLLEHGWVVDLPVLGRSKADAGTVGTTALVGATEAGSRGPGGEDELVRRDARGEDLTLEGRNVLLVNDGVVDWWNVVLPGKHLLGNLRAQPASSGTHVTVQQLEPRTAESIGELVWVLQEAASDLLVGRVEAESKIGGQHAGWVLHVGVEGIGDEVVGTLGHPLVSTSWALGQFPVVLEEVLQEVVAPLGGSLGPDDFQTAGDGVWANTGAELVAPAQALLLNVGSRGLGTDIVSWGSTVSLTKGVTTNNKSNGLLIIHSHTAEGDTNVTAGSDGVGDSIRALWVDVDQTHVDGSKRIFKLTVVNVLVALLVLLSRNHAVALDTCLAVGVAILIAEPGLLGTPVDGLVGLPGVGTATGETESLEAHVLEGDVAGEEEQIRPGDLVAILLLDGPEQTAGFVQRDVVGPAVERSETLLATTTTSAAIEDTVGTGAVPGHSDEETTIVAEVRGPPLLGVGQDGLDVLLEGLVVQALEGGGIVEVLQGIGDIGVLAEDVEGEVAGPPVTVASATTAGVGVLHWTFSHGGDMKGVYMRFKKKKGRNLESKNCSNAAVGAANI